MVLALTAACGGAAPGPAADGAASDRAGVVVSGDTPASPGPSPALSPPPAATTTPPPRRTTRLLRVGGRTRTYQLVEPARRPTRPLPLWLVLHGARVDIATEQRRTGLDAAAARGEAVLAWPVGTSRSWNAGACCYAPAEQGVDDVGFLGRVVADAATRVPVDPRRVSVVGFSAGAFMAFRAACELPRTFAAVASVAGSPAARCPGGPPVSLLVVSSVEDSVVPYAGTRRSAVMGSPVEPAASIAARWRSRNGCTSAEVRQRIGRVAVRTWSACRYRSEVRLVTVEGAHHGWPREATALVPAYLTGRVRST